MNPRRHLHGRGASAAQSSSASGSVHMLHVRLFAEPSDSTNKQTKNRLVCGVSHACAEPPCFLNPWGYLRAVCSSDHQNRRGMSPIAGSAARQAAAPWPAWSDTSLTRLARTLTMRKLRRCLQCPHCIRGSEMQDLDLQAFYPLLVPRQTTRIMIITS